MHIIAATFLLPVGVILYTSVGGIKATFLTDYFHTFVILIIACYFTVKTFTIPEIGSQAICMIWLSMLRIGIPSLETMTVHI